MKKINKFIVVVITIISLIVLITSKNLKIDRILLHISILPVTLIPYFVDKYTKFKIPIGYRTAYIIFIFFAYFLGSIMKFYDKIFMYDKIIHTISGIFTSILAFLILKNDKKQKLSMLNKFIYIISFSMLVASIWEFFEYGADIIFKSDTQKVLKTGINDTMQDMLVACFGSILFTIFNKKKIEKI